MEPSDQPPDSELPTIRPGSSDGPLPDDQTLTHRASGNRELGNYEILEEIARGGMGVVYKARHKKLNRIVALKMILAGQFASEEDIARFNLEAEATASLDHSGITPIYDIGEIDGQPYFAMKFIEGGSLGDLLEECQEDLEKSTRLMAEVAEAIHHAHQRGILHRDLKPNNILIDDEGHPLVTDFGLAKIAGKDTEHTKTGAILGTPAFMAPEQAGTGKAVTTSADIYSLGAILYRLITGQNVFDGEAAIDIVMKAMEEDPRPPSEINSKVPGDLELICLKCLQREPADRYNSAADLANDLNRHLNGEPVSISAPSVGTLAGTWVKQNMQMAGGAALVGSGLGLLFAFLAYLAAYSSQFRGVANNYERYFPQETPPWLAFYSFQGPTWMFPVVLIAWPVLIASCGFLVVQVTQPKTRNAAASAGMIAGAFFSILVGLIGVVGPISSFTVSETGPDIRALAQAAYGNEQESLQAKQQLINRYPDLITPESDIERGAILAQKIHDDLIVGIPTGLWSGSLIFVLALPLIIVGATYARKLLNESNNQWIAFARYIDVSFAVSLFLTFFVLIFMVQQLGAGLYVPGRQFGFMIMAAMLVAIAAALGSWNWRLRVPIHLLWLCLAVFYGVQVMRAPNASYAAFEKIVAADFEGAVDDMKLALQEKPNNSIHWLSLGVLQVKTGDLEGYEQTWQTMLDKFSKTRVPEEAERTAKLCLLVPNHGPEDLNSVVLLAHEAVRMGKYSPHAPWFIFTRGLAAYRKGKFEQAIIELEKINEQAWFIARATADLVNAMAHARLGRSEKAQKLFDRGNQVMNDGWDNELDANGRSALYRDQMIFEFLRGEASQWLGE